MCFSCLMGGSCFSWVARASTGEKFLKKKINYSVPCIKIEAISKCKMCQGVK